MKKNYINTIFYSCIVFALNNAFVFSTEPQEKKTEDVPVYMDFQATTPCDKRVIEKMLPFFTQIFGNPHSLHSHGLKAAKAINDARDQIKDLIHATSPREIIFTSGATESNNIAIKGIVREHGRDGKNHIITVQTEHKCVLNSCKSLEKKGYKVTYLPVQTNGLIDLEELKKAITPQTILVSVMAVNNEIGVIQPLKAIGKLCKDNNIFFHVDAAQGAGKIPIDVQDMNIDLLSISGHKLYGPKGIGALYIRQIEGKLIPLTKIIDGGGQEQGVRSGTLATPLCVGLGEACEIAKNEMVEESKRLTALRERFLKKIGHLKFEINGDMEKRIPGNLNISFLNIKSEDLLDNLKNVSLSTGSACSSGSNESHVLKAIGRSSCNASLRIGFGRTTTEEDVDYVAKRICEAVEKAKESHIK